MEQSHGRPATQIEVEAMGAIAKLQDENRELKQKIQRLKAVLGECDRRFEFYGVDRKSQVRKHIREALDPSPVSHSQTSGDEK